MLDSSSGAVLLGGQGGHLFNQFFINEKANRIYEISLISFIAQLVQKVEVLPTQFLQDCTAPVKE